MVQIHSLHRDNDLCWLASIPSNLISPDRGRTDACVHADPEIQHFQAAFYLGRAFEHETVGPL